MNITRNNYEEFFMLYADNELTAAEKKEVEAFMTANPDLRNELALFQQFKLKPDATVIFDDKASLLKQAEAQSNINLTNCESFFVLYADGELSVTEKAAVESFVYRNPSMQADFELLHQAKLSADTNIVFENKEVLYRKEKDDKIIPFPWWRMAAAAAVIVFIAGFFWVNGGKKITQTDFAKAKTKPGNQSVKQPLQQTTNKIATDQNNKNETPAKETIAVTKAVKENKQIKNTSASGPFTASVRKENKKDKADLSVHNTLTQEPPVKEDVAANKNEHSKVDNLPINNNVSLDETSKKVESGKILVAAADKVVPDQPAIFLHPEENENAKEVSYASYDNDNVEVLNTSVNTKNPLRGLLRKASRLIAKKTDSGSENDERKRILIGGFAIAVR